MSGQSDAQIGKISATPPKSGKSIASNRRSISSIVILVVIVAVTFLFALLISIISGLVSGREFSPQSFFERDFYYFRVPILHTRLSSTYVSSPMGTLSCPTDISRFLTQSSTSFGATRWDLADSHIGSTLNAPGEASILLRYMESENSSRSSVWGEWSKSNSELAKLLWPAVQQLAVHGCYFAIPELMQLAEEASSPSSLEKEIARISESAALIKGRQLIATGKPSQASQVIHWGLEFSDSNELKELQSQMNRNPAPSGLP